MADKYKFQYVPVSRSEPLPGIDFEVQTEKAINEIGNLSTDASDNSQDAIQIAEDAKRIAETAVDTAESVLNDVTEIKQNITSIENDITNINSNITTLDNKVSGFDSRITNAQAVATRAENQSNDNSNSITTINGTLTTLQQDLTSTQSDASTAKELAFESAKLLEYIETTDAVDLNSLTDVARLYINNLTSQNTPVAEKGLLDVDFSNLTENPENIDVVVLQKYISLSDLITYYRQGTVEYDTNGTPVINWNSWVEGADGELANDVATLSSKINALENSIGFIIIYPNGGNETTPANVSANSRYIEENPFPGSMIICQAELFYANRWGQTGWMYASGGIGTTASHLLLDDKIIVQTGSANCLHLTSSYVGSSFGTTSNTSISNLPCRVKVWKVG